MTNKEIKTQLQKGNVQFTIEGVLEYSKDQNGVWGDNPKVFTVGRDVDYISTEYQLMLISKWGSAYVSLFNIDMLGNKITGRIKYLDITII